MSQLTYLSELSCEEILMILEFSDIYSLFTLGMTCKTLYEMTRDPKFASRAARIISINSSLFFQKFNNMGMSITMNKLPLRKTDVIHPIISNYHVSKFRLNIKTIYYHSQRLDTFFCLSTDTPSIPECFQMEKFSSEFELLKFLIALINMSGPKFLVSPRDQDIGMVYQRALLMYQKQHDRECVQNTFGARYSIPVDELYDIKEESSDKSICPMIVTKAKYEKKLLQAGYVYKFFRSDKAGNHIGDHRYMVKERKDNVVEKVINLIKNK